MANFKIIQWNIIYYTPLNSDIYFTMYIDVSDIIDCLQKLNFEKKYNLDGPTINDICTYFYGKCSKYGDYQFLARRLITYTKKYTNMILVQNGQVQQPFSEFIEKMCTGDMYLFAVFIKYDLSKFKSCQYLEKFTGNTVNEILDAFSQINMFNELPALLKNNNIISAYMKKMFDIHLIIFLAKLFYQIDISMKYGITSLYLKKNFFQEKITLIIKKSLSHKTPLDECIEKYDLFEGMKEPPSEELQEKLFKLLHEMYEITKAVDNFLTTDIDNINEKCAKIPDLDALIGTFYRNEKTIPVVTVRKYFRRLLYIKSLIDNTDKKINDRTKVSTFRLPENKPINKMLVIDV